jgi:hypothetical protein
MDPVAKLLLPFSKQTIKIPPVFAVSEDVLPGIAPEDHMINSTRVKYAWFSGHDSHDSQFIKIVKPDPDIGDYSSCQA